LEPDLTGGGGFELHPEAAQDITDIWEYIAAENRPLSKVLNYNVVTRVRQKSFGKSSATGTLADHTGNP